MQKLFENEVVFKTGAVVVGGSGDGEKGFGLVGGLEKLFTVGVGNDFVLVAVADEQGAVVGGKFGKVVVTISHE